MKVRITETFVKSGSDPVFVGSVIEVGEDTADTMVGRKQAEIVPDDTALVTAKEPEPVKKSRKQATPAKSPKA